MNTKKLRSKIFINGSIKLLTGLHIGGNSASMEIGGVDNDIIKTGNGKPYIPGSSLKGKMRSLLAKVRGFRNINDESDELKNLFGAPPKQGKKYNTRLFPRDSHLDDSSFEQEFGERKNRSLDFEFSEIKTENVIKRDTGSAEHPRQMERVPAGAKFNMSLILDVYDGDNEIDNCKMINEAFELLEMDYIGGSGSRGSGQIEIEIMEINKKVISETGIEISDTTELKKVFTQYKDN